MKIICLYRLVDTGQQLQHFPDPISKLAFAQETHKADVQKCWGWSPHLTTGIVAQVPYGTWGIPRVRVVKGFRLLHNDY